MPKKHAKKKSVYRVLWAPIGRPKDQNKCEPFSAQNDGEASDLFERVYKNDPKFGGDILTLEQIVKSEQVRIVATVSIPIDDADPL